MRYSVVFYVQSLLIAVFILGVPSCKKKTDDCDLSDNRVEVVIEEIKLTQLYREAKDGETCQSINSNIPCYTNYKDKEKVKATSLGLKFAGKYSKKRLPNVVLNYHKPLFGMHGYACSPEELEYTNQKLTHFTVTSSSTFNQSLPAGTDLSPWLVDAISRQEITKEKINLVGSNFLSFSQEVGGESIHVLTFTFVLDNVDTLSFTTPPIVLVKE